MTAKLHASLVARENGWSFATVWRVAERAGIGLTAGREGKGYWRLPANRRTKVIAARQANPKATQAEIAEISGVSLSTVRRLEPLRRPRLIRPSDGTALYEKSASGIFVCPPHFPLSAPDLLVSRSQTARRHR